jgi:uncharacterized damage-inducible protein DinB
MRTLSRHTKRSLMERQKTLVEANVCRLRQAWELLERISDESYSSSPAEIAPHRAGGHMRHILEFYECFLSGLEWSHIDYDARRRDPEIETCRRAAISRIEAIIVALRTEPLLSTDAAIWVRMEDAVDTGIAESFLTSSIGRELQTLSSHTIHHFALIAMTLRLQGHPVPADFGMAPSTLRHLRSQVEAA